MPRIGMPETPLFQWFLREDTKTWHFNVSHRPYIFAMILIGTGEEEGQCFPETYSGQSNAEYLGTFTDLEKAKVQCLHRLKRYMNQQSKAINKNKKKLHRILALTL